MAKALPMIGGWTPFRPLTKDDQALFDSAMKGFVGVGYRPGLVATQVVSGTNYCFVCLATPVVLKPVSYNAEVYIFKPLRGDPHLTQIVKVQIPVGEFHVPST